MADQLITHGRPGAALDRGACGGTEGGPACRVGGKGLYGVPYGVGVVGRHQQPGAPVGDQVEGPPAAGATTETPLAMASCTV